MAPACRCCGHPARDALDGALLSGVSQRAVAAKFSVSKDSVRRHAASHMSAALQRFRTAQADAGVQTAAERLEDLYQRASRVLDSAEAQGQAALSLAAVRELRGLVELLAKITGELDDRPSVTVNLTASPEWQHLQGVILAALARFPDAREAVAGALLAADTVPGEVVP